MSLHVVEVCFDRAEEGDPVYSTSREEVDRNKIINIAHVYLLIAVKARLPLYVELSRCSFVLTALPLARAERPGYCEPLEVKKKKE